MKLNLGSGSDKVEGFIGVDKLPITDIQLDLENDPWPWKDDSIEEILSEHFVEHIKSLTLFMNNCHRVLMSGSLLTIVTPHPLSEWYWQDPTHIRGYTANTFALYCTGYPGTLHSGIVPWSKADVYEEYKIVNAIVGRLVIARMTK